MYDVGMIAGTAELSQRVDASHARTTGAWKTPERVDPLSGRQKNRQSHREMRLHDEHLDPIDLTRWIDIKMWMETKMEVCPGEVKEEGRCPTVAGCCVIL